MLKGDGTVENSMKFLNHVLPNGLEIVAECNDAAYSTALGFFVKTGSRDENDAVAGVSHFLEHMVFKGTPTRSPDDVNREFDMNSGSSAMQQAMSKKQVPGAESLDTILSSRSLPIRVKSRALASFAEEGGSMLIANTLQFYTIAHRVNILGAKGFSASDYRPVYGQAIPSGMKPEEFVRKFSGTVRRDSILESQKAEKKQMAVVLSKLGKLSDRKLFQALDPNFPFEENQKELIEEARIKILVAAAAAAVQGKGQRKK